MSYEKVKSYFEQAGLGERVVVREHIGDTVEHAAEAIGCEPARIAKSMSFLAGGSLNSTVKLSLEELEQYAAPAGWVDVCKDWFVNE